MNGLQVSEDMRYQIRQWRMASVTVWALAAVAVCGLLGLTGSGPLSEAHAEDAGGALEVGYQRFLRFGGPVELEVRPESGPGAAEITLDEDYLEGFDVESVTPQPDTEFADDRSVIFTFQDGAPSEVIVALTAR